MKGRDPVMTLEERWHISSSNQKILAVVIILVLGMILTVLAFLNSSVATAWAAGSITGGALVAWVRAS